ncbi:MAG: biotin/lipoyl-containing protein [Candidatus Promineifilaceae bacterium]|jgi:biotin carboxyl carrier protein
MKYYATVDGQEYVIEVGHENRIIVNGQPYDIDFKKIPDSGVTSLIVGHHSLEAVVEEKEGDWQVLIRGDLYDVTVEDERSRRLASARGKLMVEEGEVVIQSPMPGIIIAVPVSTGQHVNKGDKIVILESMKMENELRTPRSGMVSQIMVGAGDHVDKDQTLVIITD